MEFYNKVKSQQDQPDQGELKVSVFTEDGTRPVENALVRISYTGESGQTVEEVRDFFSCLPGGRSTYRFIRTDTDF